jgi:histidyl-tRNA synthetase
MHDRLKGFREFYPEEMVNRKAVFNSIENTISSYGFREIGTPSLEKTQLYVDKSGSEIVDHLYSFQDQGGRDITLTPELTPTVARMVALRGKSLPKPIKWFSTRPFWRYEQVQQGRFREFYQTNVDIFGSSSPSADAEIIVCAAHILSNLGLREGDFIFLVSHRSLLSGLLGSFSPDIDLPAAIRAIDKKDKIDSQLYATLLSDANFPSNSIDDLNDILSLTDLSEIAEFAHDEAMQSAIQNLEEIFNIVSQTIAEKYCSISLKIARGLDYYTGSIFECFDSSGEVRRSIFGGGRYDSLINDLGGPSTPAVGFAFGDATLEKLLMRTGTWPNKNLKTDYYVIQVGDTRESAIQLAHALRDRGNIVETDVSGKKFTSQLNYSNSINTETVIIVGERDLKENKITIKKMSTGEELQVSLDDFPGDYDSPTYDDFAP